MKIEKSDRRFDPFKILVESREEAEAFIRALEQLSMNEALQHNYMSSSLSSRPVTVSERVDLGNMVANLRKAIS